MEKIKVQICTGTTCFVMGSSEILLLVDSLDDELKDIVEIEGQNCMEICKDSHCGQAPFVKVNDKLISNATLASVLDEINLVAKEKGLIQ